LYLKSSRSRKPTTPIGKLEVHFINVGQGDSILVDLAEIEILIGGGGKSPGVTAYLNDYVDGQLEVMVATHHDIQANLSFPVLPMISDS